MKIKQLSETTAGAVASVAMPLGKTHKRTEEAANPAQQAAIAVNMKKAGKKPKKVSEGAVKQIMMDLKDLTDKEFVEKYKKSKAEAKKELKVNESLRDGEYVTFKVFFDDGSDETLNFSSDDIDWDRVGAKRDKKVVDVKRLGGIQGSQSDSPRKPHDFPDDRGLARAQRAYDRRLPEGVAEGMFGLSDKEKGMIQNVASEISDIPGYWDWKRDTFTPYGVQALEKALDDNKQYVKYALSLTADDYYDLEEDWQKANRKDKTSGMSRKAVKAYRRENPGSKLKTAVTTKPSKLKPGSKAAKRRKSFCARMSGNKGPMKKPNGKPTPKALALRRWNCESIEDMRKLIENAEKFIAEHKQLNNEEPLSENLHKWFKEKWVRFGPDGKIRGDCARGDDSEGKPKCLPQSKAQNLGKKGRASAAARKRREDPNPERSGKAINVNTKKKTNEEQIDELKCWDGYHRVKGVPAGAPGSCAKNESIEEGIISFNMKLAEILKERGYQGPVKLGQLSKRWIKSLNNVVDIDDFIMIKGDDPNYDEWVAYLGGNMYAYGAEMGYTTGSAKKVARDTKPLDNISEGREMCPECGGAMYSEEMINEKKDACYYKVKSRYKVWPSAYASGALVKCRKKGAKNWGTKSESVEESNSNILKGMIEAKLREEELLLAPGQGIKFKTELMPKRTDHEVEMARNQLRSSFENAKHIYQNIKDLSEIQGLDGWVQAKITKASDYLEAVNQYLDGKKQMIEKEIEVAEDQIEDRLTAQYNTPQAKAQSQAIDKAFASGDQAEFDRMGIMSPQQIERDYQAMRAKEPAQDAAVYANPKLTPSARPVQRYNPKGVPIREIENQEFDDRSPHDTYIQSRTSLTSRDGVDDISKRVASLSTDRHGNQRVRAIDTNRDLGDEVTINTMIPKGVKAKIVPQQGSASIEETAKLSAREKFKRGLKRAGYDPDAGADRLLRLIARQAEERKEFERKQKEQDEEFYKNRIKENEPAQSDNQQEQPKSNKLFDVLKGIGDIALPVGRAIYGMQGRDIPADIKSDVKTMIRNKVTGEPNK